ncbi:myo-inositol-1(or 4)-monophosphatase [Amycolatopsis xylanica]|uniref:Inositol-1-monophosphatase n=1 Tax=Amycolatopsis xylanica TaxID=589385 RepID=A0A1H3ABD2_9PSEU|nr:inositol monophosphatase family protein [Amycolatopsis xylanica]SDX26484.1 myo-inositol-1(or 4)-monophosphatase [Amycolatopsis xylanica]
MKDLAELLAIAREAVEVGYRLITTSGPGVVREKGDRDLVTDLDIQVQQHIRAYLEQATPDIEFLGEEDGGGELDQTAERIWVLDPIDGTSNFAHGLPICAVSLALVERGESVVGVIAAPFLGLRYHATKGGGAFVNEKPMRASSNDDLGRAIIAIGDYAVGDGAAEKNDYRRSVSTALVENVERVRMIGSAAIDLVWVAEGRFDACVLYSNKPWDTAAGVLIAREAGAIVADTAGVPHDFSSGTTVAVAPGIASALWPLLQKRS